MPPSDDATSHSGGHGSTAKRSTNLSTISTTLFRTLSIQRARHLYAKNGTITLPDISPRRLFKQRRSTSSSMLPVEETREIADYQLEQERWGLNLDLPCDLVAEEFDWIMYCHPKVFVPHSLETIMEVEEQLYPSDWNPAIDTRSLRTGRSEQSSDRDEEIFSLSNKESLCSLCFLAGRPFCRHTSQEWRPTLRIPLDNYSLRSGISEQESEPDEEASSSSPEDSGAERDLCSLCFLADRNVCRHASSRDRRPTLRESTEASSLRSQQVSEQDEGDDFAASGHPGTETLCSLCFLTGRTVCHHAPAQDRPTLRRQSEAPSLVSEHSGNESEHESEQESEHESDRYDWEEETLVDYNIGYQERLGLCPLCFLAERSICRHRDGALSRQSVSVMVQ